MNKIPYISSLRFIATIFVIVIHVAAPILSNAQPYSLDWYIAQYFQVISQFCVPIFFMLTGALLIPRDLSFTEFTKKRSKRILVPFIFYSLLYLIIDIGFQLNTATPNYYLIFKNAIIGIVNGTKFHLWFIYALIGVYFFIPFIGKSIRTANKKEVTIFLILWIITCNTNLAVYIPKINLINFSSYLGYTVLGYYLSKFDIKFKSNKIILLTLFIIGITIPLMSIEHYKMNQVNGDFSILFKTLCLISSKLSGGYLGINTVLTSISIFCFFQLLNISLTNSKYLNKFDKYSYGIYLIHPLIGMIPLFMYINTKLSNPFYVIIISTILSVTLSYISIALLSRIKSLKQFIT
ncbi:acyltransferase [Saccharicrinis sp. GN24d3]|uniref:acyltransferase n=1 Tax=Saccharicrinis sp. GN24d3 TaxID=3458416 RepID=UPI004036701D